MRIKSMNKSTNRKGLLRITVVFFVCSLALPGCGNAGREQKLDLGASPVEAGAQEITSYTQSIPLENGDVIHFPERYDGTIGNVTFKMDIVVGSNLTESSVVTAKASMQRVNQEKAFQLFFSGIETYDTYDYEEKDEYGENAHTVYYVSPEETTLAYGPCSSKFDYMERDLMPYILHAFVPFWDERYNADLYSAEAQLSFMTREEAFEMIQNALREMDIEIEADYKGYALDHETMQSQEHYEDMDGNIDRSQYKASWSEADDCYYFFINQTYRGLPLYHVYNKIFTDAADVNTPIQGVVSREGIEWLNIEKVFAVTGEQDGVLLADMDAVAGAAADKYNQILGESTYEMTKAELYYYVDLSSGTGTYDVKPVWIITGRESSGQTEKNIQMIIDAQTAKEIIP